MSNPMIPRPPGALRTRQQLRQRRHHHQQQRSTSQARPAAAAAAFLGGTVAVTKCLSFAVAHIASTAGSIPNAKTAIPPLAEGIHCPRPLPPLLLLSSVIVRAPSAWLWSAPC